MDKRVGFFQETVTGATCWASSVDAARAQLQWLPEVVKAAAAGNFGRIIVANHGGQVPAGYAADGATKAVRVDARSASDRFISAMSPRRSR